ncbi:MAG: acyl--CoA ligase [Caryophanon sp.]|nr:acyl--CoA ligase [Caryophanon sp.]
MDRNELLAPTIYNIVEEIERYANVSHDALIVHNEDDTIERISYKVLIERANRVANVFQKDGLQKGDVALIMVPRSVEAYVVYIAALKAGLAIIPSSEMLRAKDIDYRIVHADAKLIIADEAYISEFEEAQHIGGVKQYVIGEAKEPWRPIRKLVEDQPTTFDMVKTESTDVAFIAYTSGTTGNPKAAVHPHSWGYAHLRTAAPQWLGIQEGDVVWATAAPGWQKWIWSPFLASLGSGATAFVHKGRFSPEDFLHILEEYKVNVLCCTPTEYRLMAKVDGLDRYDLSNLRQAVSAGEPLNREVIEVFLKHFNLQVRDGYGQTENTLLVGTMVGMEPRPGSMGKPTPGNYVEVINEDGEPVAPGEVGDIAVHKSTPALYKGYLKDPERTSMQFRGEWYITGDRATKDEDGYFWFEGRGDDIIISSGYTIGPFEVEDALTKHPAVKECAVVASPDEIRGHIVKAFIVLRDPEQAGEALIKELQQHVKDVTAPYKYPRAVQFIDELPKTTSGKIRRVELRQQEFKKVQA